MKRCISRIMKLIHLWRTSRVYACKKCRHHDTEIGFENHCRKCSRLERELDAICPTEFEPNQE